MKRFEKVIADAIGEALTPFAGPRGAPSGDQPTAGAPSYLIVGAHHPSTRRGRLPAPTRLKPLVFDTQPLG